MNKYEKSKNKKIVGELILIFLAFFYLLSLFFNKFPKSVNFILPIITFFTCFEFMLKNAKEVYIYKSNKNALKISIVIYSVYLMFLSFLSILGKLNITFTRIYVASIILYLIFMLVFVIKNMISIIKGQKKLSDLCIKTFFTLLSSAIIINCLLKFI